MLDNKNFPYDCNCFTDPATSFNQQELSPPKVAPATVTIPKENSQNPGTETLVIQGPKGDKGDKGDVGPAGPKGDKGEKGDDLTLKMRSAYLSTFNDKYPDDGKEIQTGGRIPLEYTELDPNNYTILSDSIVKFSTEGWYKVTIIVSARVPFADGQSFNRETDFVAIGFREKGTDNVYVGGSEWISDQTSHQIFMQGILAIADTTKEYEIANLSNRSIFLSTPDLSNIGSGSYFVNAPVNFIAEYLGRE